MASEIARSDVSSAPESVVAEHHAYLACLLDLSASDIDVVHNHSLHYLPLAMAPSLRQPVVTTLHSPPTPWLESALRIAGDRLGPVVSVSAANAAQWVPVLGRCGVIANGVDVERFVAGPGGGGYAVWFGRIVPEKGLDLAVAASIAAAMPLRIAGPVHDVVYFDNKIRPLLDQTITYEGHLSCSGLNDLVGSADVCVVSPRWEEPFGLVVAESLAMATPVAAIDRGGIGEILTPATGRLARPDDVEALARAMVEARDLDRNQCRRHAVDHTNVTRLVDEYEDLYLRCLENAPWRP